MVKTTDSRLHFNFIFSLDRTDSLAGWNQSPRLDFDLLHSLRETSLKEYNRANSRGREQFYKPSITWVWVKFGEDSLGRKVVEIKKLESSRFGSGGQ